MISGLCVAILTKGHSDRLLGKAHKMDATIHDPLKLNNMISSCQVDCVEAQDSQHLPNHLKFMGVQDAAHANVEGGSAHGIRKQSILHTQIKGRKGPPGMDSRRNKRFRRDGISWLNVVSADRQTDISRGVVSNHHQHGKQSLESEGPRLQRLVKARAPTLLSPSLSSAKSPSDTDEEELHQKIFNVFLGRCHEVAAGRQTGCAYTRKKKFWRVWLCCHFALDGLCEKHVLSLKSRFPSPFIRLVNKRFPARNDGLRGTTGPVAGPRVSDARRACTHRTL